MVASRLREGKKRFSRNVIAQYSLQAAKYLIPFLTLPYLARVLGVEGYGVRAYVLSLMTICNVVLDFGFMISATKRISESRGNTQSQSLIVGGVLESKLLLVCIVGSALTLLSFVIPLLGENALYVAIAFAAIVINSLLPDYVFMGHENMTIMTVRYVVAKGTGLVLTFVLVRSPADLLLVPAIDVFTSVIAVTWTFVGMKRRLGVSVRFPRFSEGLRELKVSWVVFASIFCTTLFNGYTTLAIGIIFGGSEEVALWSLSVTVVSVVQSLYSPVFNSLYAYMISRHDVSYFRKILIIGSAAAALLTVVVAVFARPILLVLGGESYLGGTGLIVLTAPVVFFSFYSIAFGWPILGAYGFEKDVTISTVAAGVFTIASVTAIGFLGINSLAAFAIARCISEMILAFGRGVCVIKHWSEIQ